MIGGAQDIADFVDFAQEPNGAMAENEQAALQPVGPVTDMAVQVEVPTPSKATLPPMSQAQQPPVEVEAACVNHLPFAGSTAELKPLRK